MAQKILIDSDILIDYSRYSTPVVDKFTELAAENKLCISVMSYMELLIGARDKRELTILVSFLESFEILSINQQISQKTVELIKEFNLSHGLQIQDAIIASTALTYTLPLWTKNIRDFRYIKSLNLIQ